ncbi:MAG: hypothetical protein CVU42_11005 [Chloroflexi bacterium HGW-Chloroflexi-4]|jgi:uncharacterized OB-fold protein|nr:MAG: hypothetical protein CVU42_11005 [Chloroflexi bacterium HGW-Chloroflexi-4]
MKAKRILFSALVFTIILTLTACNLPIGANPAGTPDIAGTVAAKVAIEQAAQTMVAQTLSAAQPAANTSTNTIQAPPEATFTPTLEPTITLTPTLEGVFLTVSQDTYCRFGGPYSSFKIITTVKIGQKVEVIARNPENDSYYVKNPYEANSTCWLYGKYATVTGNASGLTVATMNPTPTPTYTPTPAIGFSVNYVSLETCGPQYAFKLFIKNTGSSTWQYISITGSDTVTAFAINHSSNTFKEYAGCVAGVVQADLTPGESSYVLNVSPGQFNYDPTGHNISINVTLCTLDGGAGTCKSVPLSFTP